MIKKIFLFVLDSLQAFVFAISIFVLLYFFIAQPNQVNGNSMYPSFENKEFLLTDKISYRFSEIKRGDVVVFKAPPSEPCAEDQCEYIKRVIGLPGDVIKVDNNHVFVNQMMLSESYLPENYFTSGGGFLSDGREVVVPEENYILMGDNRSHSRDSREFGFVHKSLIVGKAFVVYWPVTNMRTIEGFNYSL